MKCATLFAHYSGRYSRVWGPSSQAFRLVRVQVEPRCLYDRGLLGIIRVQGFSIRDIALP